MAQNIETKTTYQHPEIMKLKNEKKSEKFIPLWNAFLIHIMLIGIFFLNYAFKTEDEKDETRDSIEKMHAEDDCYLEQWKNQVKKFEQDDLFFGRITSSKIHTDGLSKAKVKEIGYGITPDEVSEAKRYGLLPEEAKIPSSMTRDEAEKWFERITLPTYKKCVKSLTKNRKLTSGQEFALISFCHNLGDGNLRKLLKHKDAEIAETMKKFVYANGKKCAGLVKRRAWEASLWEEGSEELLASR